ncbi:MAG: hypothetical protein J5612_01565 [Paludibacteraceae bacterium]|nr:hypothetical protein [Paludibacteraceae bacterium]
MSIIKRFILLLLILVSCPLWAQQEEDEYSRQMQAEVKAQLVKLTEELKQLADDAGKQAVLNEQNLQSAYYIRTLDEKAQSLNRRMQAFDVKWEAFSASNLAYVANFDTLMNMTTQAQLQKQEVTDAINAQVNRCNAIKDFAAAETYIFEQDSLYKKLYKQAFTLSFVQKMTPQLEKLKAQEQLQFPQVQEQYDKAKAAADLVPQLRNRADNVNEAFYAIKAQSESIQQLKYEPFIQRIKDYLMGLAYVAIILIFFNMIISKWQAAKKAKEALQKQIDALKKDKDYPTI